MTTNEIGNDLRVPDSVRVNTSRPRASVPEAVVPTRVPAAACRRPRAGRTGDHRGTVINTMSQNPRAR